MLMLKCVKSKKSGPQGTAECVAFDVFWDFYFSFQTHINNRIYLFYMIKKSNDVDDVNSMRLITLNN